MISQIFKLQTCKSWYHQNDNNNNNNNNKQTFQGRTINKSRHKGAGGDYNPRR